jgi:UDP-glucose 4-epimerase
VTQDPAALYAGAIVAVTGASGYLGAAVSAALLKTRAHRLLLVSRRDPGDGLTTGPAAGVDAIIGDVRKKTCWEEIVRRADVVFHLAGNTSVSASVSDPAASFASTVLPLTHLLAAACEARRTPRVVYASTARVYGRVDRLPVCEGAEARPATPFGLHNLHAEQLLASASHEGVLDAVSLRLGNAYGPSPCGSAVEERNVLNKMTRLALRGDDLPLFGDGNYMRDYVFIDDVMRAFLLAGATPGLAGQSLNVASGCGVWVRDALHLIAERAARATGKHSQVREVPWPDGETTLECNDFVADVSRMKAVCGWTPDVSFCEGIDRLVHSIV